MRSIVRLLVAIVTIASLDSARVSAQLPRVIEIPGAPQLPVPPAPQQRPPTPPPVRAEERAPQGDGSSIFTPQPIGLGAAVTGRIEAGMPSRFFLVPRLPSNKRDWVAARLETRSPTLQLCMTVYNDERNKVEDKRCAPNAAANVAVRFLAMPSNAHVIEVGAGSAGDFQLTVTPGNDFDAFEPSDSFANAAELTLGKPASDLNIMDSQDRDFYRFKSGTQTTVALTLENQSMTLVPCVTLYDESRNVVGSAVCGRNPGSNIDTPFKVAPDSRYFVEIASYNTFGRTTVGAYSLVVK